MINDSELGYAVLFCSTQKHCNPDIAGKFFPVCNPCCSGWRNFEVYSQITQNKMKHMVGSLSKQGQLSILIGNLPSNDKFKSGRKNMSGCSNQWLVKASSTVI